MKPYFETDNGTLYHGDCLEVMQDIPAGSVDLVLTDPPYELGFMGKKWDASGIAYNVDLWKEALRVLKPGGHLLSFGGTRTYHRMAVAIEDAGFEIRDMLEWIYASGFPKSMNVGKAYDKICGESDRKEKFTKWMRTTNLSASEINKITDTFMGSHYLTAKEQPAIPTAEIWAKLRPHIKIEIPKWVDELVERIEKEREVVGKQNRSQGRQFAEGASGFAKGEVTLTKGTSQWEGFGSALKPAHEPIVLARKPLSEKTIVENCMKHGTGALDIDGCRIPTSDEINSVEGGIKRRNRINQEQGFRPYKKGFDNQDKEIWEQNTQGRFPANLLVTNDALNDGEMTKSPKTYKRKSKSCNQNSYGEGIGEREGAESINFSDSGSKSRYFDIDVWAEKHGLIQCPKASKSERNAGCEGMEEKRIIGDVSFRQQGVHGQTGKPNKPLSSKNNHPTVKPLHLMSWLIRLASKEGDTVLDPFMGSGTTGVACNKLGREFIGIEISEEYCEIAANRIEQEARQMKLFG